MTTRLNHEIKISSIRELWSLFDRTRFAIGRLRELELARYGLSIEQSAVLYIITNWGGSVVAKDLENATMRQHHSISSLINGMNKTGLVRKVKTPGEKRFTIEITEEGHNFYSQATTASLQESISVLSAKDRQQLIAFLVALLEHSRRLLGLPQDESILIAKNSGLYESLSVHEIWSLLDRTGFAIARLRDLELVNFNITIPQASVLHVLSDRGGSTNLKELENVTMRQQHSISSLIIGMVNLGLVRRVKNADEKWSSIVLTDKGNKLCSSLAINSLETAFAVVSKQDQQVLATVLEMLLERARYLLGISYQPPFIRYLISQIPVDTKY
ncbi:MAG TPA: MarR family transcriptional regulator [Dehalococcoidales bacterium]